MLLHCLCAPRLLSHPYPHIYLSSAYLLTRARVVRAVMSAKAISEQTGKEFLYKYICTSAAVQNKFRYANVTPDTSFDRLAQEHPWLLTEVRRLRQLGQ